MFYDWYLGNAPTGALCGEMALGGRAQSAVASTIALVTKIAPTIPLRHAHGNASLEDCPKSPDRSLRTASAAVKHLTESEGCISTIATKLAYSAAGFVIAATLDSAVWAIVLRD
jgi:hypothetical protein